MNKIFSISFILFVACAIAEEPSAPKELAPVRAQYHERIEKAIAPIQSGYVNALEELKRELGSKGNIDGGLLIQKELDYLAATSADKEDVQHKSSAEDPEELSRLRKKYDKAVEAAIAPINLRYDSFLVGLKKKLGGEGDINSAKIVQTEIDKLGVPEKYPVGSRGRDRIVIWNQANGGKNDRGSTRANVVLYDGEKEVWRKDDVRLSWTEGKDESTKFEAPRTKANRIRVEITKYHFRGGGLAEIQYFRDGKNIAQGGSVKASAYWQNNKVYAPSMVADGNISGDEKEDMYWLLPNGTAGWIEVTFK